MSTGFKGTSKYSAEPRQRLLISDFSGIGFPQIRQWFLRFALKDSHCPQRLYMERANRWVSRALPPRIAINTSPPRTASPTSLQGLVALALLEKGLGHPALAKQSDACSLIQRVTFGCGSSPSRLATCSKPSRTSA